MKNPLDYFLELMKNSKVSLQIRSQPQYLLLFISSVFQISKINVSLNENNSFRQSQTVMLVREFLRDGFDPSSPLPIFGAQSKVPFEFPIFQYFSSLVASVSNSDPISSTRLVGVVSFQLCAVLIYALTVRWLNKASAIFALMVFQFSPFGLQWGHAALMEFSAVASILGALYINERLLESRLLKRKIIYCLALVTLLTLGALIKVTTFVALVPLFLIPALKKGFFTERVGRLKRLSLGASIFIFVSFVSFMWNNYADYIKSQNVFTSKLTSQQLSAWNFGYISDRLDVTNWYQITNTYWGPIIGGTAGLFLIIFISIFLNNNMINRVLILAVFTGPLLFMNLYWVHDYYSIAIFVPLTLLAASSFSYFLSISEVLRISRFKIFTIVSLFLLISTSTSVYGKGYLAHQFRFTHEIPELSKTISANSDSSDGVIFLGCDWNPLIPYYADRKGLMLPPWGFQLEEKDLSEMRYLALCQEPEASSAEYIQQIRDLGFSLERVSPNFYLIQ
jgi:hypothetical protein